MTSHKGPAGIRLQARFRADISDELLREFATDRLGAERCSAQYLEVLRVVLGNQANAEKCGHVLEMNQRVPFATPRVMRTVIDQMRAGRISFGAVVGLGQGRSQTVQCFSGRTGIHLRPADELERRDRRLEAAADSQRDASGCLPVQTRTDGTLDLCQSSFDADLPY